MSAKSSDENKTALQPKKRRPEKELNHDNWDEEEEPEEKGEFVKASEEKLKDRKIIKARRKVLSLSFRIPVLIELDINKCSCLK